MPLVRKILLPLLIAVIASCWLLPSLENGMLWEDEAQTALLARTTLQHGAPIAFDGENSISQEQGDDYGPHRLWKWHMWLPFYVLAAFFRVFGESTATARLPFALFGVATVVLAYFTSMQIWRDWRSATIAALLILVCVPFALLVRQCRYYSPCMFFSLLMLYAYLRICGGWKRGWILLAVAAALLFNSHFIYTATAFAAIVLHALIWHRKQWKPLLYSGIATAILCSPPTLWLASLNYRNYSKGVMSPHFLRFQMHTYLKDVLRQILPYPILLIPVAASVMVILSKLQRPVQSSCTEHESLPDPVLRNASEVAPADSTKAATISALLEPWALPLFFAAFTVVAIAPFTPWPFFRYVGPLIAPLLIIAARWVIVAFRMHVILGIGAVVLLLLWWPDRSYAFELRHRLNGPVEGIVQLLKKEANPGDVVVISYEDLPLKFYTRLRILGGLAGDELSLGRNARWLILRAKPVSDRETPVRQFIEQQLRENSRYKPIVLTGFPDTKFENREEPGDHLFRTSLKDPPVVVYELKP